MRLGSYDWDMTITLKFDGQVYWPVLYFGQIIYLCTTFRKCVIPNKINVDVFLMLVWYFVHRKDWMRILALKTFAVTIGLHYNNDNTLGALKQLNTVSMLRICMSIYAYITMYVTCTFKHVVILSIYLHMNILCIKWFDLFFFFT